PSTFRPCQQSYIKQREHGISSSRPGRAQSPNMSGVPRLRSLLAKSPIRGPSFDSCIYGQDGAHPPPGIKVDVVLCICGCEDEDKPCVRCDICNVWQHTEC